MTIDPLRGDPNDGQHQHLVALLRPELANHTVDRLTEVQLRCAWAWHEGATAVLGWTESNHGVYPGNLFPHNPYEITEEEP